ncbi:hypothetical protein TNCT_326431 [Trichonephila clavata]|uniref:Uncharacterized protein n=1 Tax=Trichonephila clavata TaxID=2740835 RepID=A0A8X6LEL2_TRICU|nr:hypothetical protein TNCT_326431 [Trichonephila clavata]
MCGIVSSTDTSYSEDVLFRSRGYIKGIKGTEGADFIEKLLICNENINQYQKGYDCLAAHLFRFGILPPLQLWYYDRDHLRRCIAIRDNFRKVYTIFLLHGNCCLKDDSELITN